MMFLVWNRERLNQIPSWIGRLGAFQDGGKAKDVVKSNQLTALYPKGYIPLMIKTRQSDEDELDESTFAKMRALNGSFMGYLLIVA